MSKIDTTHFSPEKAELINVYRKLWKIAKTPREKSTLFEAAVTLSRGMLCEQRSWNTVLEIGARYGVVVPCQRAAVGRIFGTISQHNLVLMMLETLNTSVEEFLEQECMNDDDDDEPRQMRTSVVSSIIDYLAKSRYQRGFVTRAEILRRPTDAEFAEFDSY